MILSALAAVGADLQEIEAQINAFFPDTLQILCQKASDGGIQGLRVTVRQAVAEVPSGSHGHDLEKTLTWSDAERHPHPAHRGLEEIGALIGTASFAEPVRQQVMEVFQALAEAEAEVHGKTPQAIRFHEVGAWDSVADIVGACLALEQLGICGVSCGPLPSGVGTISCAHGEMPNPAPATQRLLSGMAVRQTDEPHELVTPTGAALLRTWMRTMEPVPETTVVGKSGFGIGVRTLKGRPNVLRATVMDAATGRSEPSAVVLETNLDDCNPEWIGTLMETLLKQGALDVWQTPILMKKGRSGVLLSVLCEPQDASMMRERIFAATTTFGIRFHGVDREILERRFVTVKTPYGEVSVKQGIYKGEVVTVAPEHDACVTCANAHGVTVRRVSEAAKQAALKAGASTL